MPDASRLIVMTDITSARLIKLKGLLFLILGLGASVLLVLEHRTFKVAALLAIAVWSFCRFYYFAFYVIGHYVDATFRFSGLGSFARYWLRARKHEAEGNGAESSRSRGSDDTDRRGDSSG